MRPRVEHLANAFGIGEPAPRLSWQLPPGAEKQIAYRVRTGDGRDSGWIAGTDQVLVPWPFAPLGSAQRVTWQVRVRTGLGESDWSAPCPVETGLLRADDWSVSWIRPAEPVPAPAGHRPGYELHGEIECGEFTEARLYATAHGIYEVFVNGVRAGDQELTPGFTQYASRLQVQTYDVGPLLVPGANQIGVGPLLHARRMAGARRTDRGHGRVSEAGLR